MLIKNKLFLIPILTLCIFGGIVTNNLFKVNKTDNTVSQKTQPLFFSYYEKQTDKNFVVVEPKKEEVKENENIAEAKNKKTTVQNKKTTDKRKIVASRGNYSTSDSEVYTLAKLINAEAKNQPYIGKVAVGAVVVNRMNGSGKSLKEVIFAPKQFEPVSNGMFQKAIPSEEDIRAAKEALSGVDPTNGATSFYAYKTMYSRWHESKKHVATIGDHKFFK